MDLSIDTVTLEGFRSYSTFELSDIGPLTILVGPNAAGKTNIIEAIQLLTSLSSFRNATTQQLVAWGQPQARIEAWEKSTSRDLKVSLNISEEKKEYQVNGKKKRPKDIRGILPSVIFSPDDLHLAKGPHSIRRAAVDAIGTQLNANYHTIKKDYERLIRHKNYLLKEEQPPAVLQSVNDILAVIGTQLQCYRYALFQKLAPLIQEHYQGIAGSSETLACSYTPFWKEGSTSSSSGTADSSADSSANDLADTLPDLDRTEVQARFAASFKKKEAEERQRRQACTGPHTDRVGFSINGSDAGIYGSQGQQRSLVLAFKLAELAAIQDIAHQKPVLLLDDVMSELDSTRRSALLRYVSDDIQTFITTTTLDYFPKEAMQDASVVTLPSKQAQGGGKAP